MQCGWVQSTFRWPHVLSNKGWIETSLYHRAYHAANHVWYAWGISYLYYYGRRGEHRTCINTLHLIKWWALFVNRANGLLTLMIERIRGLTGISGLEHTYGSEPNQTHLLSINLDLSKQICTFAVSLNWLIPWMTVGIEKILMACTATMYTGTFLRTTLKIQDRSSLNMRMIPNNPFTIVLRVLIYKRVFFELYFIKPVDSPIARTIGVYSSPILLLFIKSFNPPPLEKKAAISQTNFREWKV